MRMVVIFFLVPWHEVALGGGRRLRTLLHRVLEQHVHEQIHRLGLDDQSPGRVVRAGVEVVVHASVMHDRDIAGLPVVARAVVDFVARAIENVEGRLVHMAVLLSLCARGIFLEVNVQRLGAAVLGLHIMPAEMLRAAVELEVLALDHPRHRPQPGKLVLETVGPCNARTKTRSLSGSCCLSPMCVPLCDFPTAARAQCVGLVTISRYCLLHFGYSSSPLAGSRKWSEAPSGSGLAFARAGKKSRASKMSCPSVSMNSKNRIAAFGCEARRATAAPSKRATPGGMTNQSIGAPLLRSCSTL